MDDMILSSEYDIEMYKDILWITEEQIRCLHRDNHIIGLHSHTHPTLMSAKSCDEQMHEYEENKKILESIIQGEVVSVSYPCNSYNSDTDAIMKKLGICLGFDAIAENLREGDDLHFPRMDHAYIVKEMMDENNSVH